MNKMIKVEQLAVVLGANVNTLKETFSCGGIPKRYLSIKALKVIQLKESKGYCLSKIKNKKHGFVYYVRYYHEGKMLSSRWSTHTSDFDEAQRFAEENRESIIADYLKKKAESPKAPEPATEVQTKESDLSLIENYYADNSKMLEEDKLLGRRLQSKKRISYYNFIKNKFVPFLKKKKIDSLSALTAEDIFNFRLELLKKNINKQTVNSCISGVKMAFEHLTAKSLLPFNVFKLMRGLTILDSDKNERGCYYVDDLKGVFDKPWDNEIYYLLNLIIHTTGMSNKEIGNFKFNDIVKYEDCHFVDVTDSKTDNRTRLRPLHKFVYQKIESYIKTNNKSENERIFKIDPHKYTEVYRELGRRLNKTPDDLKSENITYYSGRHYFKTLLNAEGLGEDIEEYFMGHAVSSDVKKSYNHKDKQGRKRMLAKAREIFKIFNENLFNLQYSLF